MPMPLLTPAQRRALAAMAAKAAGPPLPAGCRIALHFHPDRAAYSGLSVICAMTADGRYRSQFEIGGGNGACGTSRDDPRWRWESQLFHAAYDHAPVAERPLYGALCRQQHGYGPAPRFGSCHLLLNPVATLRSSFCYPDSSADPHWFGVANAFPTGLPAAPAAADRLDDYVEAHLHGPLRLQADVEAIVLDPCYRGTAVHACAARMPAPLHWHPGYCLPLDRTAHLARYRPGLDPGLLLAWSRDGRTLTAADLGVVSSMAVDGQQLKWAWHCIARFGAPAPPATTD